MAIVFYACFQLHQFHLYILWASSVSTYLCSTLLHHAFQFNNLKPPHRFKWKCTRHVLLQILLGLTGRKRQRGSQKDLLLIRHYVAFNALTAGIRSARSERWYFNSHGFLSDSHQPVSQTFYFCRRSLFQTHWIRHSTRSSERITSKKKRVHGNKQTKIAEGEERQKDG